MARDRWWTLRASNGNPDLKVETESYWNKGNRAEEKRLAFYVQDLLPYELRFAQERGALEEIECHTLVLLVGHSLEPLFQAIGLFEPRRIVLLLNTSYGCPGMTGSQDGEARGEEVKRWIETLLLPMIQGVDPEETEAKGESKVKPYVLVPPGDSQEKKTNRPDLEPLQDTQKGKADRPDAVFRALCNETLNILDDHREGRSVIVDVTGAKKSMDAGAFLFAAYFGIPVSYVDFDCYDPERRRPYGYTCRIGRLDNPYATFDLHRWEQVRRSYERYRFRAAREALHEITKAMKTSLASGYSFFEAADVRAAVHLCLVLRFYEAWDDGDCHRAGRLLRYLQPPRLTGHFPPPDTVVALADTWASLRVGPEQNGLRADERVTQDSDLLTSNDLLLAYARDEMAKIERLVEKNEDNRSALLRAVGLDELLLKARWVRLWNAGDEGWIDLWVGERRGKKYVERRLRPCRASPSADFFESPEDLYGALVSHTGDAHHMRDALQGKANTESDEPHHLPLRAKKRGRKNWYHARPAPDAPRLASYEPESSPSAELLTGLRNQAVHKYQYVTRPLARAALELARANLEDFADEEKGWLSLAEEGERPHTGETTGVECLSWERVCALCDLRFLPTVTRSEKGERA